MKVPVEVIEADGLAAELEFEGNYEFSYSNWFSNSHQGEREAGC